MKKKILTIIIFAIMVIAGHAQQNFSLKISGDVNTPKSLSLADLHKYTQIEVPFVDKGGNKHLYKGVAIQEILSNSGVTMGANLRGENLSKYVLAKCADGYQVLFSLAELDTSFSSKKIIVADSIDGKPLPEGKGPLRIIVPNEQKPARSCFQLEQLIVKFAKD